MGYTVFGRDEFLKREREAFNQFASAGVTLPKRSYICEDCGHETDSPEEAYDHVCNIKKEKTI